MTQDEEYRMRQELYGPTHPEIRRKCLEIQKTWSDWQRAYRAGLVRGEPRNWQWINGRSHCYHCEFGWTAPQYLACRGEIGRSDERRYRELRVWDRVG